MLQMSISTSSRISRERGSAADRHRAGRPDRIRAFVPFALRSWHGAPGQAPGGSRVADRLSMIRTGRRDRNLYTQLLDNALDRAVALDGRLSAATLGMTGMSGRSYRMLVNNLVASVPDARYLEIGSWMGSTRRPRRRRSRRRRRRSARRSSPRRSRRPPAALESEFVKKWTPRTTCASGYIVAPSCGNAPKTSSTSSATTPATGATSAPHASWPALSRARSVASIRSPGDCAGNARGTASRMSARSSPHTCRGGLRARRRSPPSATTRS